MSTFLLPVQCATKAGSCRPRCTSLCPATHGVFEPILLLCSALKKEQKRQEKKGKEWKQRQKQQKTEQASKQQK